MAKMSPVGFGLGLGDSLRDRGGCPLDFEASLATAVAETGPIRCFCTQSQCHFSTL